MMFGFGDKFSYFECQGCGCLQIAQIPPDMAKYYPKQYYSFSPILPGISSQKSRIKKILKKYRDNYFLFDKGLIGRMINFIYPGKRLKDALKYHFPGRKGIISFKENTKILDVGCGNGSFIYLLKESGLKNLLGLDTYLEKDIVYPDGLSILKKTIQELNQEFDLIFFNHSFEHMADPFEVFKSIQRLLSKDGFCLIRIPTVSSYAWKHYRENWVQLDAPRHFYLHSIESMKLLAEKFNLKLKKVVYDSTDFQFWGSEQYLKDITLTSDVSYGNNKSKAMFTKKEIKSFKKRAKYLNLKNQGDQTALYFQKI